MDALAALLKLALKASSDGCRARRLADQWAGVGFATAKHSSQVSQLLQCGAASSTSSDSACECIVQSGGMGVWLAVLAILACNTEVAYMSTAMTLPAQLRKGSKTSIKAININRVRQCIFY